MRSIALIVIAIALHVFGARVISAWTHDMSPPQAESAAIDSGLSMALAEPLDGDMFNSIKELQARADIPKKAWRIYEKALHEDRRGRQDEAVSLALKAVQIAPDFFQAHAALAAAYLKSGVLDSAEAEMQISLRLNPHYLPAYELQGILLYLRGDLKPAVASLTTLLKSAPNRPAAHYFLGCALRDLGNGVAAGEQFATAERLRRDPPHPVSDESPWIFTPSGFESREGSCPAAFAPPIHAWIGWSCPQR
jgi:tetratricopeptide (TPR) repeat protein